jgi:NADH:ubiquinone reductase (H+-translocating)
MNAWFYMRRSDLKQLYLERWFIRRPLVGLSASLLAAFILHTSGSRLSISFLLASLLATGYSFLARPEPAAYISNAMIGGTVGIVIWAVSLPLTAGRNCTLDAGLMRNNFGSLIGWVFFGLLFGLFLQVFHRIVFRIWGGEVEPAIVPKTPIRIVVLGGGFAGMRAAERLEALLQKRHDVTITLVSDTNSLLFTPMLAEVAGGSLEPSHIGTPLRGNLKKTVVVRARAAGVDSALQEISLLAHAGVPHNLSYDYLVIAVGSVSNFLGLEQVEKVAFNFRTLVDAVRIRNHVIQKLELADKEPNPEARRHMLRFVIAGGGFAGVELAGSLNDLARGILANYPGIDPADVEVVLVHSRDRILPELTESLAKYALERMTQRGVIFRLNTRVKNASDSTVVLETGPIQAETLIWTAGSAPQPLLASLPFAKDKRGCLLVDKTLAVQGAPNVWALGDCAAVEDPYSGKLYPPTAQFALREADRVARNLLATINGKPQSPFYFKSLGALCVVGHQTACAELAIPFGGSRSVKFSGLAAWLLWRGIYLAKLPSTERKVRVLLDWTLELFFPRDIVQTIDVG